MSIELYLILLLITLAALYFIVPLVVRTFIRYRGKRVITCPETRLPAGIEVDATHAAITAAVSHPDLRLKSCSRWPEREDCGQECLLQVELSPEACLVRNLLTGWYDGKYCVSCGKKMGALHRLDHRLALLTPEDKTVEWSEIPAEEVPGALTTHYPVCWDCHIVQTFCREYPDVVVDRSRISEGIQRGQPV
jgi:hypothetical protein